MAFVALASFIIVVVFCRMSYHHFEVILGRARWNEPLDMPNSGRRSVRDSPRAAAARGRDIEGNHDSIATVTVASSLTEIDGVAARGDNSGV